MTRSHGERKQEDQVTKGNRLGHAVAIYEDTGTELKPQPTKGTRDSKGCYAGCIETSCAHTDCRRLPPPNNLRRWFWERRP